LVAEGRVTSPAIQTTAVGEVPVEIDVEEGFGWMRQLPPVFGPEFPDRVLVARAAGLEPGDLDPDLPAQVVSTGLARCSHRSATFRPSAAPSGTLEPPARSASGPAESACTCSPSPPRV
jgi:hypothetical protein